MTGFYEATNFRKYSILLFKS